jgi:hypothetical protein
VRIDLLFSPIHSCIGVRVIVLYGGQVSRPQQLVRLWRNEGQRIFCDRLTTDADLGMVNGEIEKILKDKFADHAEYAMQVGTDVRLLLLVLLVLLDHADVSHGEALLSSGQSDGSSEKKHDWFSPSLFSYDCDDCDIIIAGADAVRGL